MNAVLQDSTDHTIRATAKMDGTCCLVRDGQLWARQDLKHGRKAPDGWFPTAGSEPDAGGHIIGFHPLGAGDKWHIDALRPDNKALFLVHRDDGFQYKELPLSSVEGLTVELVGPKVNGNKHGLGRHALVVHGSVEVSCDWRAGHAAVLMGRRGSYMKALCYMI